MSDKTSIQSPLFSRLPSSRVCDCTFSFNGKPIKAVAGESVAAALLASDALDVLSAGSFKPYCLMGTCYGCLVQIDGRVAQSCMTEVSESLVVTSVDAAV